MSAYDISDLTSSEISRLAGRAHRGVDPHGRPVSGRAQAELKALLVAAAQVRADEERAARPGVAPVSVTTVSRPWYLAGMQLCCDACECHHEAPYDYVRTCPAHGRRTFGTAD